MNLVTSLLADVAQPGQPGMRRFRHRARNVKMEYRLRRAGPFLHQPTPAPITRAGRTTAAGALPHKIDIGVVLISRPVALKVVEKGRPGQRQAMGFKIAQRE